jgi:hypothetical protein
VPGHHDGAGRHDAAVLDRLRPRHVDDRHARRQGHVRGEDGTRADAHSLGHDAARAEERPVLDDHGARVGRLEHAADADAAREVDVGADLRARPDGRPGVDHRPRADPGADVDVPRHEDDARRQERAVAGDPRRHDPDAALRIVRLHGDLVEEAEAADLHRLDLAELEVLEDGRLRLDVDDPLVAVGIRDAAFAAIERGDDLLHLLRGHSTSSRIATARAHASSSGTSASRK